MPKRKHFRLSADMKDRIRSMIDEGYLYRDIVDELGVSLSTVSRYAKSKDHVDDRAPVGACRCDEVIKEIELLKQGMRVLITRIDNLQSQIQSMIQAQASTQQSPSPQAPQAPTPQAPTPQVKHRHR